MPAAEVQEVNLAKFGQKQCTNNVSISGASTLANPSTGTLVLIVTAGEKGGMLTSLSFVPLQTVTDCAVIMFVEKANSAVRKVKDVENLPGWTYTTASKPPRGAFRYTENASFRMEAGDKIYMSLSSQQSAGVDVSAEWTNF